MGKNSHQTRSGISVQHSDPGCMWGILHILKYHHWHLKRRLLPRGNVGGGKHAKGERNHANYKNVLSVDAISQHNNVADEETIVDDKKIHPTSSSKGSVKSRIKALISDELSKRKGQHRRSSTYPVRSPLVRTDSMHHIEPSDHNPPFHINLTDPSPGIADDINSSATESLVVPSTEHKFEECNTSWTGSHLEENRVDGTGKQLIDDGSPAREMGISHNRRQNLTHAKEIIIDASSQNSKEILDALDMINMNREFFVKVLQDSSSPLFHHFHNQQTFSTKKGYSKSVSFPSIVSSPENGPGPSKLKQKQKKIELNAAEDTLQAGHQTKLSDKSIQYVRSQSMPSIASTSRADGILKLNQAMAEVIGKRQSQNPVAIKHFKNLKQKIKHAIQEGKKEKHRISMDAIFHKIPHGQGFSRVDHMKDHRVVIKDAESPRSSFDSDHSLPSESTFKQCRIKRTSSLGGSLDRCCQLYGSIVNSDAKPFEEHSRSLSDPKSMGSNFSLPDIKSYFHHSKDTSLDAFPSIQAETAVDETASKCNSSEQKSIEHPIPSDFLRKLNTEGHVKSDIPDNLDNETFAYQLEMTATSNIELDTKVGVTTDDMGNLKTGHNECDDLQDCQLPNQPTTEQTDQSSVPQHDSESQEDTTARSFSISDSEPSLWHLPQNQTDFPKDQLVESRIDRSVVAKDGVDKTGFPSKNLGHGMLQCQVDGKNKLEYDYVKDILRLSGFTGDELLGTWHSDGQPMDPSLFQELEGCMLLDPDCSGNEEGGNCYHLMLFDLINEVLMDIYAKSYAYYPVPLCPLSQIRPMPVGQRVLQEVWEHIRWYLDSSPQADCVLDYAVNKDLAKSDGWMNMQYDAECVGLELEDFIFDDLLEEAICTWVSS